ncbi:MAG: HAD-IA family hydrolase [Chloroflexota bacterium]|nr:HAD-IA family hydrolase [Chloroflexota bacterium]
MDGNKIFTNPIEAILFDLDGTLVETDNRWAAIVADRLKSLQGIFPRLDTERWGRKLVMAIETPSNYAISLLEHVGLGGSFLGLADLVRQSRGLATQGASVMVQGTEELLTRLKPRYTLGIVTTRARADAHYFLKCMGYQDLFSVVITRQDVLRMKPHPAPVEKAMAALHVSPQRCIMVGDTAVDVRAARGAGAYAVAVLSGFGQRQELERAGAHLVLERAVQLLDYLPSQKEK